MNFLGFRDKVRLTAVVRFGTYDLQRFRSLPGPVCSLYLLPPLPRFLYTIPRVPSHPSTPPHTHTSSPPLSPISPPCRTSSPCRPTPAALWAWRTALRRRRCPCRGTTGAACRSGAPPWPSPWTAGWPSSCRCRTCAPRSRQRWGSRTQGTGVGAREEQGGTSESGPGESAGGLDGGAWQAAARRRRGRRHGPAG